MFEDKKRKFWSVLVISTIFFGPHYKSLLHLPGGGVYVEKPFLVQPTAVKNNPLTKTSNWTKRLSECFFPIYFKHFITYLFRKNEMSD